LQGATTKIAMDDDKIAEYGAGEPRRDVEGFVM
jgi:hypothetical protein